MDFEPLNDWIGRSERRTDLIAAAPAAALAATLDRDDPEPLPGDELPPLAHWLYFLPIAAARELGEDGHPRRGGFLPPVPLPRRMWAGGRLEFMQPLCIGDEVQRTSRIADVRVRAGRSGSLVFVVVRHELESARGLVLTEEHDIVYREMPVAGTPLPAGRPAQDTPDFGRDIVPDPIFLFRYSALTFNGHRIHYDRPYATGVEGYPGLVVHGPLVATLLVDLVRRELPAERLRRFSFKAERPLFDIHRFSIHGRADGRHIALWSADHDGLLSMSATAELE